MDDFKADVQAGGTKYPELYKKHQEFTNKIVKLVQEYDPEFKPKDNYFPEMDVSQEGRDVMQEVSGLWMSKADLEMGSFMENKGILEGSSDYGQVMKNYYDQALKKVYLDNMKGANAFEDTVIDYSRKIGETLKDEGATVKDVKTPDFVAEGNKLGNITQTADLDISSWGTELRTNDNIFGRIGGELGDAWKALRDIGTKEVDGDWTGNKMLREKAIQDFVETAGNTEFTNGRTQQYVNDTIANVISKKQVEKSLMNKFTNAFLDVTSMAHLGFSIKTGILQLLETTKIPALFKGGDIVKGLKGIEGERLTKTYRLDEYANPHDLRRIEGELEAVFGLRRVKKAVQDVLFYPLTKGENTKNIIYASIAEQDGISKGIKGDELVTHVRDVLNKYGNVVSKFNRAELFNKDVGRLLFQYGQYNVKSTTQIADALEAKETKKAIGLIGSNLFT